MSIVALEGGSGSSGDDHSAELPTSGVVAKSESDSELTAMLAWAT